MRLQTNDLAEPSNPFQSQHEGLDHIVMNIRIFDLQRFSLHDGPGIRTNVFFKGCNLRCVWCHNPESQKPENELLYYADKCVGCGACRAVCSRAFTSECRADGKCISVCKHGAREISGKTVSVEEILLSVKRDSPYYSRSGGGITLSGGEPLLQHKAACFLLEECKRAGIHTAIETAGNVPFSAIREVMPVTDLFLFDIKGMDPVRHKRNTGVTNELILDNAVKTAALHSGVRFRMPYVPGFNDDEAASVAGFAKKLNVPLELMAYHNIGLGKYRSLNRTCETEKIIPPSPEEMRETAEKLGAFYDAAF